MLCMPRWIRCFSTISKFSCLEHIDYFVKSLSLWWFFRTQYILRYIQYYTDARKLAEMARDAAHRRISRKYVSNARNVVFMSNRTLYTSNIDSDGRVLLVRGCPYRLPSTDSLGQTTVELDSPKRRRLPASAPTVSTTNKTIRQLDNPMQSSST